MNKHYSCIILLVTNHYFIYCNDLHRNNKLHGYWTLTCYYYNIYILYIYIFLFILKLKLNTHMHKKNHSFIHIKFTCNLMLS